jgi:Tfp pilus assembly protein PilF
LAVWAGFLTALALAAPAQGSISYHQEIAPILAKYCASCHRPGQSGPFPLLTYEDARKRATQIAAVTFRRYMPPWLPEAGYGDFADVRRLSDAQIQAIQQWARDGAPEGGRPPGAPRRLEISDWQLGPPDLVIQAPKSVAVPPDGPDIFWNFILSPQIQHTRYVKAIEIRPGNTRVVHHANVVIDRAGSSRRLEQAAGGGFPGMDLTFESDTFDPDTHFLFWKPGGGPRVEPEGLAWRLDPGNDLVLNVHLRPSGKPEDVRPLIGLYFAAKPPTKSPMLVKLGNDRALDIPASDRDFPIADDFRLPVDVDVLAIYPHAHYLGKLLEAYATLPDGSRRWLIRIPDWDVNWQAVYSYRSPVFLPKGTVVSMRYHYDNSAANPRNPNSPPRRVRSGNQSTDEMGHLWLQVLIRGEGDQRPVLQEALMQHRLQKWPDDTAAHLSLGALLLSRKDTGGAIIQLREGLRAAPEQAQALNNLGAALQLEGRIDEAVPQFQHAVQIEPEFSAARYNLAVALVAQGKREEAAAHFRRVLAARPDDADARQQLSAALIDLGAAAVSDGRLTAAAEIYRELAGLDPKNADIRNNLGILLVRTGDTAGAIAQFEAALQANPSHAAARRNLDSVRAARQ